MATKKDREVHYWLMKSEPAVFGIADLQAKKISIWDGIRNYQVRNLLRDVFAVGDKALFYHSSCEHVGVAGEMEVVRAAYPDPTQFDKDSHYYDAKSPTDTPRWLAVDVRYGSTFSKLVTLASLRADPKLAQLHVLERGNRLSVTVVTKAEYEYIVTLGNGK